MPSYLKYERIVIWGWKWFQIQARSLILAIIKLTLRM
jgi:hypothetical protein